jgi:hypothetical protein
VAILQFLGTGDSTARGKLSEAGFLIKTPKSTAHIDPGVGAGTALVHAKIKEVNATYVTDETRGHDKDLIKMGKPAKDITAEHKPCGIVFQTPNAKITYLTKEPEPRDIKQYTCDTLVLYNSTNAVLIQKIAPKLCILTGYTPKTIEQNPLYIARDISKATGVQTIAAQDGIEINLKDYSATQPQKHLSTFTEEEK